MGMVLMRMIVIVIVIDAHIDEDAKDVKIENLKIAVRKNWRWGCS